MSFENVVLTYPHPHVAVYVEDNTEYTETFLTEDEPVKMIQCGAFAQGRDNKLIYCADYGEFISEFGEPNFKLYGQPGYNVARALKTGYAGAYVLRVMPEDATYANVVIMMRYKVVTDEQGNNALSVSYTSQTVQGATSEKDLKLKMKLLNQSDPDDEGYYTKPLLVVYSAGRGKFGNNLRFRIADVTNYEDPYGESYKTFRFDVLRMESTLVRKEYAFGTFDYDLFDSDSKESLYLQDIINDPDEGLGKVRIIMNEDLLDEIVTLYNTQVIATEVEEIELNTLDIIYGRTMEGDLNPYIRFDPVENEATFTAESDGVSLFSGSDGSLDVASENRDDVLEELLVQAYSGEIDRFIKSRFSTPADFMLDANFPETVKRAMAALAMRREYDCTCYLDSGLIDSTDGLIYWLKHFNDISDPNVVKELQHYKYRDSDYTGKTIDVTTTYFLAGVIPTHIKTVGLNVPIAMSAARISEAVKGSFSPVIDPDDNDIKKLLWNLRGNYYETVKYNVYQRGTANNSQLKNSDRMREFNNYITNLAVNLATDVMYGHIYNFAEEDDRQRYQQQTNDLFQLRLGPYVRSCTVEYEMTADDERKNILRLKIRIVFKTVVERGIVEVYLDPRTSTSTSEA